jgi:ABC-type multidrug transport system fused ATPase/permease subunit
LFRLYKIKEGKIEIGKKDISKIPLQILRSNIAVIPQDSVLFSGTVRSNLDPFNKYKDLEIWDIIEKVSLKNKIKSLSDEVKNNGENFSSGERQLICIARALLLNKKILICDESTSSCDYETDLIIQKCLRKNFKNSTIISIAHRIETISDFDRIVVIESGKVLKFVSASEFLKETEKK